MNDLLTGTGIVLGAAGAVLLAMIYLYPESARRESRRVRNLTYRARDVGLRGRYTFESDRSRSGATRRHGTYTPSDDEDRALFAVVGSRIEGEAVFFANEMLWTDEKVAWVGVPLLVIGAAIALGSVFV
jgi:hypothetical protein